MDRPARCEIYGHILRRLDTTGAARGTIRIRTKPYFDGPIFKSMLVPRIEGTLVSSLSISDGYTFEDKKKAPEGALLFS